MNRRWSPYVPGRDMYLVGALTAAAAAARLVDLGHQSFWVDETITARLVAEPFADMLAALPRSESAPPLYYLLAWCWSALFGNGEAALRSLSALLGTATIPVAFAAGRALVSRNTGLFAAALATVSPLLVWYSQEARAYALFVLLSGLSLVFFARALDRGSRDAFVRWALASALALLTHYFAAFLVAAEAAFLLHRHRGRIAYASVAAVAAVGFALMPLAAYQAKYASSKWIRLVDLRERVEETFGQVLIPSHPSIWAGAGVPEGPPTLWPLGLVLVVAAGVAVAFVLGGRLRRGALVSLAIGATVVAAPIVLALVAQAVADGKGDVFLYRNVICAWLPLTIAVAAAMAAPRAGWWGKAAFGVLCAASVAVLIVNATTPHYQRDDWRAVARAVEGPGRVIVLSPSWELAGLEYYAGKLEPLGARTSAREIALVSRHWTPSYSPTVETLDPPSPFTAVEKGTVQNWELTVFRSPRPVSVIGAEVASVRPEDASRVVLRKAP